MKKLLALALSVMLLLSVAICAQGMETTGAAAPSPAQAPREGLNKDIYVDREWSILNAKHGLIHCKHCSHFELIFSG